MAQIAAAAAGYGSPGLAAAPAAAAAPAEDYFFVVINNLANPTFVPMGSSRFQFNGSTAWRLELPQEIIVTATKGMTVPLSLCVYLTPSGAAALGGGVMDLQAALQTSPGCPDGQCPGFSWKWICRLGGGGSITSISTLDWTPFAPAHVPHSIVLMMGVFPSTESHAELGSVFSTNLNDAGGPLAAAAPHAAAGGGGGGGVTHVANLPANMISSFIGPAGRSVKALQIRHGHCKISVDSGNGKVTAEKCPNPQALHAEIMQFISNPANQGSGAFVQSPGGGGGGGGGGRRSGQKGRNRNGRGGGGGGGGGGCAGF